MNRTNWRNLMECLPRGFVPRRAVWFLTGCLCLGLASIRGQTPVPPKNLEIERLAAEAQLELRIGVEQSNVEILTAAQKAFEQCVQVDRSNALRFYDLARTEFALANALESKGEKKAVGNWLDRAIEAVQHSLALDDRSSDAHSLLADLYGTKIGRDGFLAAVRLGPKATAETETALRLDSGNPRVHLTVGRKYLYSPRMFGGDVDRAIESFKKASKLDPLSDDAFIWLSIAYTQKGDKAQAKSALDAALRLNPRRVWAQRLRQGER